MWYYRKQSIGLFHWMLCYTTYKMFQSTRFKIALKHFTLFFLMVLILQMVTPLALECNYLLWYWLYYYIIITFTTIILFLPVLLNCKSLYQTPDRCQLDMCNCQHLLFGDWIETTLQNRATADCGWLLPRINECRLTYNQMWNEKYYFELRTYLIMVNIHYFTF